jgi:hypothetical protein
MLALKSSRSLTVKVEAAAKIKVGINGEARSKEASRFTPTRKYLTSNLMQAMAELVDWSTG